MEDLQDQHIRVTQNTTTTRSDAKSMAKQFVEAGKGNTWPNGKPYFEEPDLASFGEIHRNSNRDGGDYLLFEDNSVVNMSDDQVISIYNNNTKKFE